MGFFRQKFENPFRGAAFFLFLFALICVAPQRELRAERVEVCGLELSVDGLEPADAGNIRVTLGGESYTTSNSALGNSVLQRFLTRPGPDAALGTEDLEKCIRNSISSQEHSRAAAVLMYLLSSERTEDLQFSEFISDLVQQPGLGDEAVRAFQMTIEKLPDSMAGSRALALVLFHAGEKDPDWLRSRAVRLLMRADVPLRDLIKIRFIEEMQSGRPAEAEKLSSLAGRLYGTEDSAFVEMRLVVNRMKELRNILDGGKLERLYPVMSSGTEGTTLTSVLMPLIAAVLRQEAEKAIAQGDAARALVLLSWLRPAQHTPATPELALKALQLVRSGEDPAFSEARVADFLRLLAVSDERILRIYIDLLEARVDKLLDEKNAAASEKALERLLELRPDPDAGNDRLRFRQALMYASHDMLQEARSRLGEMQSGLSWFSHLRLFVHGYYGNPFILVECFLAIIIIIALLLVRKHYGRAIAEKFERIETAWQNAGKEQPEEGIASGFTLAGLNLGTSPRRQEYERCLAKLGLRGDATLKEIKSTYRLLVKAVHPDLHNEEAEDKSDKLVELNQAYDRILEIRKELGVPEES